MNEKDYVRKDVYDANLDTILLLEDKTNERINDVKDSINRQLTIMGITIGAFQLGLALILYVLTKHWQSFCRIDFNSSGIHYLSK